MNLSKDFEDNRRYRQKLNLLSFVLYFEVKYFVGTTESRSKASHHGCPQL